MVTALYYLFSFFSIFSAIQVIWSRNPVQSVLYLVLVFINVTGLLLLLEVEFMAIIFLIVYVGAIAVLFLFVVMMLAPKIHDAGVFANTAEGESLAAAYLPVAGLIAGLFIGELYILLNDDWVSHISTEPLRAQILSALPLFLRSLSQVERLADSSPIDPDFGTMLQIFDGVGSSTSNMEVLGQVLYTYYFFYFLLAGFILLLAMIGAIVLTLQTREEPSTDSIDESTSKRQQVFEQLSRDSGRALFLLDNKKS